MTMLPDDRTPVIVGVGEITDRPDDPSQGLEPLALMQAALGRACADADGGAGDAHGAAGARLFAALDSLDVVNQVTWPYDAPAAQLCARLGVRPARVAYGEIGGETPVRFLAEAASRIARGRSSVAAVCGAEAQNTLDRARRAGIDLPWTPAAGGRTGMPDAAGLVRAQALNVGAFLPVTVYPFYENACLAQWGQTPRQALTETGVLWAGMSRVAAANPYAWLGHPHDASAITTPGPANRMLAWPYTKLMVANPSVNQGAAVLMTSLAVARAAGIPTSRMVFVWGGAGAHEPRDYLMRDTYHASPSQDAVLLRTMELAGPGGFTHAELYSCFPCVPKMARRTLGMPAEAVPTVTGGLTFFGAPLNDTMTHAACAMVGHLRLSRSGSGTGLLYGQGEFVTKHHALVLSADRAPQDFLTAEDRTQHDADRRRGPVPAFAAHPSGPALLETFTIIYDRDGAVRHGVVIARMPGGDRCIARVPAGDEDAIGALRNMEWSPVGRPGHVITHNDETVWRFT